MRECLCWMLLRLSSIGFSEEFSPKVLTQAPSHRIYALDHRISNAALSLRVLHHQDQELVCRQLSALPKVFDSLPSSESMITKPQYISTGGKSYSGYCVGPSDLQCCVTGSSTAQYGVDISATISSSTASCLLSAGHSFIIPRCTNYCSPIHPQLLLLQFGYAQRIPLHGKRRPCCVHLLNHRCHRGVQSQRRVSLPLPDMLEECLHSAQRVGLLLEL